MRPGPALRVERTVFAALGAFLVPWTVIYVVSSDDRAGGLLLALCAVALLGLAAFLAAGARHVARRAQDDEAASPEPPDHAPLAVSVWPLLVGIGATVLGFGMAFTSWVAVPAGLLIGLGVAGYARESMLS
jgi:hypothetical protein